MTVKQKVKFGGVGGQRSLEVWLAIVAMDFLVSPETNLITPVSVQEHLKLPEAMFGTRLPLSALFLVEGAGEYEVRCVWVDGAGATAPAGDGHVERQTFKGRQRFMAPALRMPTRAGSHVLALEWRHPGQDLWARGAATFPLDIDVAGSSAVVEAAKPS